ncbi:DUF3099 domain-containing protein [Georgenia yuyongxinii]|uniref:DUF3099 domain-containing protein n=1 Tax=Georgenia yuyongxinii TaxID=2589797 RepID=A0A552WSL1_9MICO|nr:DUF3099 domain-containing protein [Georgenia yuyongxinii]TRW45727.1 DUF3099 domain-containing protein [Georgenia yuyongxinii]
MRGRHGQESRVYAITSAPRALAEDVHARTVRYLTSMGIRTGCMLLLFVVPGWWKWVAGAGAIFLPMIAVLFANAGRERPEPAETLLSSGDEPPELPRLPYDPNTEYLA